MPEERWKSLDSLLRPRVADLPWDLFEQFFLDYLNSGLSLSISRQGQAVTRRVISAEKYASGSGKKQKGIDLRLVMEGGEIWVVQCKRVKKWTEGETQDAIKAATAYSADHYFLALACDPAHSVHDKIEKHPQWTLWNLSTILSDFRRLVPPAKRRDILSFLPLSEVRRFLPFTTEALITPESFFERFLGEDKPLRHDWPIVGREEELKRMSAWGDGLRKVLLLSARGGEGKTRLVREFASILNQIEPDAEVLFLNPHRDILDSNFFLGLNENAVKRIIVIDDAHRADLVPMALLDLARQDPKTKLILASRPQGQDSIVSKLIEIGISATAIEGLHLPSLKRSAAKALAQEILGEPLKDRLEQFLVLTERNPFLITTAGGLIRQGRLKWDSWSSDRDFRRRVFEEFQNENLSNIPESERPRASRLLRLLAILSPVTVTPTFVDRATALVGGAYTIEQSVNFLRQVELLVGHREGLRVSPDLLADFLVYETCFDPEKREPLWAKRVIETFADHGAALIRNISEASWIARLNGVNDDQLLEPLMASQRERFLKESFIAREATLRYWTSFSQYLPKESLELAELAIQEKTAPADQSLSGMLASFDNHAHVLKQIPGLLRPVAKYHLDHSHKALDILWELGKQQNRAEHNNQNHPWSVIAELFKFEAAKPIGYNLSALTWLEQLFKKPETMAELEKPTSVLRLFLEPCFSRLIDGSYIEGRTFHFVEQEVRMSSTRGVRDRALKLLGRVIEHGSDLAVLDALGAVEVAVQRAGLVSIRGHGNLPEFIATWRPERLKALALYRKALECHPSVVVCYEICHTLKRGLIHEEDPVFKDEARQILASIPDTLPFRTAVALAPDYGYVDEEVFMNKNDPDRFNKSRQRWDERVKLAATEIAEKYPEPSELFAFLDPIAAGLLKAGYSLGLYRLLLFLGASHPELALGLADSIVSAKPASALVQDWPALVCNDQVTPEQKLDLFEKAVKEKAPGATVAVIRHLSGEAQQDHLLDDRAQALLFEVAHGADDQEILSILQIVEHSSKSNSPWAFSLLRIVTEKDITPNCQWAVLKALAPFQARKDEPHADLVSAVFKRMVKLSDLGFFDHGHEWHHLKERYPFQVYELLCDRVLFGLSGEAQSFDYMPVPHPIDGRVRLPGLANDPRAAGIVDELWSRIILDERGSNLFWIPIFQAIAFEKEELWHGRVVNAVGSATTKKELSNVAEILGFEGSLIIFEFPELTQSFLDKAATIGGQDYLERMYAKLYVGAGPRARGYTGGELQTEYDYIEDWAGKAAEKHKDNPVLGAFYQWIVWTEQESRVHHRLRAQRDDDE
jgi:hypothetical protein